MRITIDHHVYFHSDPAVDRKLESILEAVTEGFMAMSVELDRVKAEVTETKTIQQSAIVLLNSLSQMIRDHIDDPAALTAIADDLDASGNELAAAVQANTPAAPNP